VRDVQYWSSKLRLTTAQEDHIIFSILIFRDVYDVQLTVHAKYNIMPLLPTDIMGCCGGTRLYTLGNPYIDQVIQIFNGYDNISGNVILFRGLKFSKY